MSDVENVVKNESVLSGIFNKLATYDHFLVIHKEMLCSKLLNTLNGCEVVYIPAMDDLKEVFRLTWNGNDYRMGVEEAQKYSWVMGAVASQYSLINTSLPHKITEFIDKQAKG